MNMRVITSYNKCITLIPTIHKVNTYKDPNDHNMKNWNIKWNEQDYDAKLYLN